MRQPEEVRGGTPQTVQLAQAQPASGQDALRTRTRELLFDYLAVARRGIQSPPGSAARQLLEGPGASIVEGTRERAPATTAALVNGIAGHAVELDDTYEPASLHPGVAIWPAVLALADERHASVGEALDAAIAAYDVIAALGARLDPAETYARGFHPTGICGSIGAAVGASVLLGLNDAQQAHAIGIAASTSSGLLEFLTDGAWTKPFHAGHAAASGIVAARLASGGYVGPGTAVEGPHGFLHAFGGRRENSEPLIIGPRGSGILGTALKLYPCCRYTHGNLDLLLELMSEEDLRAEDVASVSCGVLAAGWTMVAAPIEDKRRIAGTVDGQFSMPFTAALALTRGAATLEGFAQAAELGVALAPLMARIHCHRSDALEAAFPDTWGAEIKVRTKGGATLHRVEASMKGAPARPLSSAELRTKAEALIGGEAAGTLLEACLGVGDADEISRLERGAIVTA